MKRYIVTDKHPVLKPETLIHSTSGKYFNVYFFQNDEKIILNHIASSDISEALNDGWIEEIQEPKFTKDNMLEFASECTAIGRKEPVDFLDELGKFIERKL